MICHNGSEEYLTKSLKFSAKIPCLHDIKASVKRYAASFRSFQRKFGQCSTKCAFFGWVLGMSLASSHLCKSNLALQKIMCRKIEVVRKYSWKKL